MRRADCDERFALVPGLARDLLPMGMLLLLGLFAVAGCGGAGTARSSAGGPRSSSTRQPAPSQPPPSTRHGCFSLPSACGYPDPTNTGVPPGRALKPYKGDLKVSTPGKVISGLAVTGSVEITASHVTIKDTEVTSPGGAGHAIWMAPEARDVVVEDSTVRGAGAITGAIQYGIQNAGDTSNRGLRLDLHYCAECWAGPGALRDSYAVTNGKIVGAHYEAIYYGGGGGYLIADHNTLFNPEDQTADVFTNTDFGNVDTVTIMNNLMAGGGYMIYGGAGGSAGTVHGPVTVTGNRFARCLTEPVSDRGGGHYCRQGPDSHGYWPAGGHYGISGDFNDAVTTWKGNYWDDDGAPVANPA